MKHALKPLTIAVLIASAPLSGVASAQTTTVPTAPTARAASAPVSDAAQRHFENAVEAFARKDYKTAATEIRKATGYLRLEARHTTGNARRELTGSVAELDRLAAAVDKGAVKDKKTMVMVFARANHALALAHRTEAAESWARKDYNKAGDELEAAAGDLENAAAWAGAEAKAGASRAAADTQALGATLATGATATRHEVGRVFGELGNALNHLGHKIGAKQQAEPVKSGS